MPRNMSGQKTKPTQHSASHWHLVWAVQFGSVALAYLLQSCAQLCLGESFAWTRQATESLLFVFNAILRLSCTCAGVQPDIIICRCWELTLNPCISPCGITWKQEAWLSLSKCSTYCKVRIRSLRRPERRLQISFELRTGQSADAFFADVPPNSKFEIG